MNYELPNGRILYVTACLEEIGYATHYSYINDKGEITPKRYKSFELPVRTTLDEAQADLDVFADKKGLKKVGVI